MIFRIIYNVTLFSQDLIFSVLCTPQAEKNRAAAAANNLQKGSSGPMRLYVGSLHFNITEEMLRGIFEPFGKVRSNSSLRIFFLYSMDLTKCFVLPLKIEGIQLMMDSETGRSKGYGFISVIRASLSLFHATVNRRSFQGFALLKFADAECAKKALEQLNGFELAGRPMKVGHVTERSDSSTASSFLDNDELERTGIDLGTTGRLQLMARLAEGLRFSFLKSKKCPQLSLFKMFLLY